MIADPLALIRGAHFAATLLASGTVCFMAGVVGPRIRLPQDFSVLRRRLNAMIGIALALAILTGAMWLVWLASDVLGKPLLDVCLNGGALSLVADTRFGWISCARLALALLLGLLILLPTWRGLQLATAAAFLALPAFAGHAGATPGLNGDLHIASDVTHLLAAGAWLGALPALVLLLYTARCAAKSRWYDLTIEVTRRFSAIGVVSVGALLASGVVNTWSLLDSPRDLWTSDYGRLIAFKIGLFAAMTVIAAANKFSLTPRLPGRTALRGLQRNSLAEIGFGICVLALVGLLGRLPPPAHGHSGPSGIPPDVAFTHIHVPEAMADVTIDPGRAGRVSVTIHVARGDFSPIAAKDVQLVLEPPAALGESFKRTADNRPDGTWVVNDIDLPTPGIWTVRVNITSQSGTTIMLDAPIVIER